MGNMSYCRFYNTKEDLIDCLDNINATDLSDSEKEARIELYETCKDIIQTADEDIIYDEEPEE